MVFYCERCEFPWSHEEFEDIVVLDFGSAKLENTLVRTQRRHTVNEIVGTIKANCFAVLKCYFSVVEFMKPCSTFRSCRSSMPRGAKS